METIDRKFKFLAVNPGNGNIFTDKEGVVFLAKDDCFLPTLKFYLEECIRQEASVAQITGVNLLIDRVTRWRLENLKRCKTPDVASGKEADIVLADPK